MFQLLNGYRDAEAATIKWKMGLYRGWCSRVSVRFHEENGPVYRDVDHDVEPQGVGDIARRTVTLSKSCYPKRVPFNDTMVKKGAKTPDE
jgi:hypothetical protein